MTFLEMQYVWDLATKNKLESEGWVCKASLVLLNGINPYWIAVKNE